MRQNAANFCLQENDDRSTAARGAKRVVDTTNLKKVADVANLRKVVDATKVKMAADATNSRRAVDTTKVNMVVSRNWAGMDNKMTTEEGRSKGGTDNRTIMEVCLFRSLSIAPADILELLD